MWLHYHLNSHVYEYTIWKIDPLHDLILQSYVFMTFLFIRRLSLTTSKTVPILVREIDRISNWSLTSQLKASAFYSTTFPVRYIQGAITLKYYYYIQSYLSSANRNIIHSGLYYSEKDCVDHINVENSLGKIYRVHKGKVITGTMSCDGGYVLH